MRKSLVLILSAAVLVGCVGEQRLPEGHYGESGQETPETPEAPAEGSLLWVTIEDGSPEYICFSGPSKLGVIGSEGNQEMEIESFNGNKGVYQVLSDLSSARFVYPNVDGATFSDEAFHLSIPSEQRLQEGKTCDTTAWRCVGTSYGDEMTLTPVNGFVGIQVGMEGIDRITVEGEGLSGDFSVQFGEEGTEISRGNADEVTLLPHGTTFALGTYALSVVPGEYESLKVSYWKGAERSTVNLRTASDFVRNRVSDISDRVPSTTWVKTIYSKEQFLTWAEGEHGAGELINIDADLDLEGATIRSFGFDGSIEGNRHRIYNFKVDGVSLFSSVKGSISELVFGSSDGRTWDGTTQIEASGNSGSAWGYVGLIGGLEGSLADVTSFVPVTVTSAATGKFRVGGLVSRIQPVDGSNTVMLRCHQYGPVNHLQSADGTDKATVGGLVGLVDTPNPGRNSFTMTECSNHGAITVNQKNVMAIGGLAGGKPDMPKTRQTEIKISVCKNAGNITFVGKQAAADSERTCVGGMLGFNMDRSCQGQISSCVNEGDISCRATCYCVAGIIGMALKVDVSECVNRGDMTVIEEGSTGNWNIVGGIVGFEELKSDESNTGSITGCTNEGDISATIRTTRNKVPFPTAGGIAGDIKAGVAFTDNVNTGTITAKNLTDGASVYAGGIAGGIHTTSAMTISGNINRGTVSATVTGDSQNVGAGGIVGRLEDAYLTSCSNSGTISCSLEGRAGELVGHDLTAQ